jgi:trans-2,3-dihydro-3-hydroxyanthranilate isomerase
MRYAFVALFTKSNAPMKYDFYILDVFSPEPFGGNQLGVLPNAEGISDEGMQKIAREFNFAETTFVFPPTDKTATARVRIFTPNNEVDFAGHPTVGTACALVYGNHIDSNDIILEENIGLVSVSIEKQGDLLSGTLTNTAPLEQSDDMPSLQSLGEVLSLNPEDVIEGFYASVGLDFCFVRLASREAVDNANIDKSALSKLANNAWSTNIFFFAGELEHQGELYARMSAPFMGIEEDPATGSAVAALVGVAAVRSEQEIGTFELSVVQGVKMGRTSRMQANAITKDASLASVGVGGAAAFTATGQIEVAEKWRNDG